MRFINIKYYYYIIIHFLLCRPPSRDLQTAPPSLSLWRPMQSGFGDGGFLAGNVANPPPAPPHQDGSHGFGSTPFEQVFV